MFRRKRRRVPLAAPPAPVSETRFDCGCSYSTYDQGVTITVRCARHTNGSEG